MIKNFQEYEQLAITTKCYSDKVAIAYVTLGLCGEASEFFEKINEEAAIDLTLKEAGDILWYIAAMRMEMNLSDLHFPIAIETETVNINPLVLMSLIGQSAEQIKKYLRDEWKDDEIIELSEARKEVIHTSLQSILNELSKFCFAFDSNIIQVAQDNIDKLADRAKRDQIHGSGDER